MINGQLYFGHDMTFLNEHIANWLPVSHNKSGIKNTKIECKYTMTTESEIRY